MKRFELVAEKFGPEIEWKGKILRLLQDTYVDERVYGDYRDETLRYTAIAVDKDDNEYRVFWNVLDVEEDLRDDASNLCDWCHPDKIVQY